MICVWLKCEDVGLALDKDQSKECNRSLLLLFLILFIIVKLQMVLILF